MSKNIKTFILFLGVKTLFLFEHYHHTTVRKYGGSDDQGNYIPEKQVAAEKTNYTS